MDLEDYHERSTWMAASNQGGQASGALFFVNQSSYIMLYFHAVLHSNNIVTTNIKIVDLDLIH